MSAKKNLLGLIDAGSEVRRPPLVGMQFLHECAVGTSDFLRTGPRLKAKDLISLLFGHFARTRRSTLPRVRTVVRLSTHSGLRAGEVSPQWRAALRVDVRHQDGERRVVERIERGAGLAAGQHA